VERTKEQEEDLGISDMVTEGYEGLEEERVKTEKTEKAAMEAAAVASEAR
jgi:hypothetical protein